ncbi:MAG TPA: zf-HC2 domain-containing protein [Pyrinomonadaceae bacterium]
MTRCLDEAKLQCYFDGELSLEMMESVTSHLASCATCAAAARELEEESALLMTALAPEFEANVPTERLRQRIDEAVLGERLATATSSEKSRGLAGFFAGLLNFGTQRTLGYASLAVVLAFAAIVGVVKLRTPEQVVSTPPPQQPANVEIAKAVTPGEAGVRPAPVEISTPVRPNIESKGSYRPVKSTANSAPKAAPAPVKLIPGERAYLQTIARLDSTIKSNKQGMRPALQVEYERNLAVVDRAIAATRSAAKSNPNDPDAADFMFAAYQSKVDLLNTIADARVGGPRH